MDTALLINKFAKMGARVRFGPRISQRENRRLVDSDRSLRVDIQTDRQGEYFDIRVDDSVVDLDVVDLKPEDRHLLLLARRAEQEQKDKFLCGHDERHWFVAAVPDVRGVSNIRTAMEALKPHEVREAQDNKRVKFRDRGRRRTSAYVRQGEWFFLPEPDLQVPDAHIILNEPLQRGAGKPHMAENLYRKGGVSPARTATPGRWTQTRRARSVIFTAGPERRSCSSRPAGNRRKSPTYRSFGLPSADPTLIRLRLITRRSGWRRRVITSGWPVRTGSGTGSNQP